MRTLLVIAGRPHDFLHQVAPWRAVVFWACVLLALPAGAQKEVFVPAVNVSFTITTERKTYRLDEHPVVKYRIENVSNRAFYVPKGFDMTHCVDLGRPRPGPHIWGDLVDSTGKRPGGGWASSCGSSPDAPPPSVKQRIGRIAILLRPGEHADGTYEMQGATQLKAGSCRLEVTLKGWDAKSMSAEELAELQTMDPLLQGATAASAAITLVAN